MKKYCSKCGEDLDQRLNDHLHPQCRLENDRERWVRSQRRLRDENRTSYQAKDTLGKYLRRFSRRHFLSGLPRLATAAILEVQPASPGSREADYFERLKRVVALMLGGDPFAARLSAESLLAALEINPPKNVRYLSLLCRSALRDIGEPVRAVGRDALLAAVLESRASSHQLTKDWIDFGDRSQVAVSLIMHANLLAETPTMIAGRRIHPPTLAFQYIEAASRILGGSRKHQITESKILNQAIVRRIQWSLCPVQPRTVRESDLMTLKTTADEADSISVQREVLKVEATRFIAAGAPEHAVAKLQESEALGQMSPHRQFSTTRFKIQAYACRKSNQFTNRMQELRDELKSQAFKLPYVNTAVVNDELGVHFRSDRPSQRLVSPYIAFFYEEGLLFGN